LPPERCHACQAPKSRSNRPPFPSASARFGRGCCAGRGHGAAGFGGLGLAERHAPVNAVDASRTGNVVMPFGSSTSLTYGTNLAGGNFIARGQQTARYLGTFNGNDSATITFDPTATFQPGERIQLSYGDDPKVWEFIAAVDGGYANFGDSGQSLGDHNTYSVALGDLDGDGDLDLLEGNFSQASRVWLNDGSGSFSSGQTLGNYLTLSVALGDLDGDGDLDLLTGNYDEANRVWFNQGSGTFSDSGQSLGTFSTRSVALGDLDGDGDLDLLEGNVGRANRVWLNDGAGTFSDSGQTLGAHATYSVALGDLDGDGDLDLLEGNYNNQANRNQANRVWLNDGAGTFSDSGQTLGDHAAFSVALGDLDLLAGNYNQANRVWLNQPKTWTVTGASNNASFGSLSCASGTVTDGGTLSCTAYPASGYYLADTSLSSAPVTGDCTVTGQFAAMSATLSGLSHTYDGTAKSATCATTPSGQATTITYDGAATAPSDAGNYPTVCTITGTTVSDSQTLRIAQATQTLGAVTCNPPSISVGATSVVSATASSGLAVSFASQTGGICTLSGSTVTGLSGGVCTVVANQSGNLNYQAASAVTGQLNVGQLSQRIDSFTVSPSTLIVGGVSTASASASSGLDVSFSSQTPTRCTVSGQRISGLAEGTCTVAADQPGDARYQAAPQLTRDLTVTANGADPLILTTPALPNAVVGVPYAATLSASGGQPQANAPFYAYSASGLPAGLMLSADGVLSGTPLTAATATLTVTVTDANGQSAQRLYPLNIAADLAVATASLSDGVVGGAYAQTLQAIGGALPYA
jgi:hypothetical protein